MLIKKLVFILFLLIYGKSVTGQVSSQNYALNPKIGIYNFDEDDGGLVFGFEFNFTPKKLMYSMDILYFKEISIVMDKEPLEYFVQTGIMIGKYFGEKKFWTQLQGGFAPLWGLRRTNMISQGRFLSGGTYESDKFFTVGLVFKMEIKLIPYEFFSIGLDIQANLNPKKSLYMPMLSLEFGNLRKSQQEKSID